MKTNISVCNVYKLKRKSIPGRWDRCRCKFAEGDKVQPVPELLLEEHNYFQALVFNTLY